MRLTASLVVLLGTLAGLARASAADTAVDLQLVLAVDVSRSMDADEQRLQREGYANAFRHPDVINAITGGARGRIAVTYVEWAGNLTQWVMVGWQMIAGRADAEAFADKVDAAPLNSFMGTSISAGLRFSADLFRRSPEVGDRRAIDVSGDGPNNIGPPVAEARDWVVGQGITVNGLPIMLKSSNGTGPFGIPNLDIYYEDCVIGGPGAFSIPVNDMRLFETAIRRKLVLEIAGLPPGVMPAAFAVRPPRIDCLIGEKSRPFRQFPMDR